MNLNNQLNIFCPLPEDFPQIFKKKSKAKQNKNKKTKQNKTKQNKTNLTLRSCSTPTTNFKRLLLKIDLRTSCTCFLCTNYNL